MKKVCLALVILAIITVQPCFAQFGGFGGNQNSASQAKYSQKFSNLNYAGDGKEYHTLDIYLPEKIKDSYPVIVHTYGSAWMSNNSKGMADINTIVAAYLNAGYAVICPNHRSSSDAKYPAQINDIKAVIRYARAHASEYKLNVSFIGISGFSSGAHLAALAGATNGLKVNKIGNTEMDIEGSVGPNLKFSSNVNAVCEWSGPIDIMDMDCGGPRNWNPSPEETVVGAPIEGNEDRYQLLNPINYLDKKDPAVMIFHGKQDNVVPYCQGQKYNAALEKVGIEHYFIIVDEGGHGVNMYSEENLKKMVDFMNMQCNK